MAAQCTAPRAALQGFWLGRHPATPPPLWEVLDEPLLTASLPTKKEDPEYRTDPELIDELYGHEIYTILDGGCALGGTTAIVSLTQGEPEIVRPAGIPQPLH